MVRSHGVSDSGVVRQANEDCFAADDRLSIFVVADGMGGRVSGEVASRVAVESIVGFIERAHETDDLSWPCGLDPTLTDAGNRVRTAIHIANRQVCRAAEDDEYAGMGTTVVCALIHGGRLAFGHVGDSRLYVFSRGALEQQTRDDTWAASVLGPEADDESLTSHPMRHVLTNVLGTAEGPKIHVSERELTGGELLLLCTDGVHNVLDAHALSELLSTNADLEAMAGSVVAAAIERGSRDNLTALIVRYDAENSRG
jgi:serine/threonine protein phosphatase PrpC